MDNCVLPDFSKIPTPCYVVDERRIEDNLKILADVQRRSGCKVLLALKSFALHDLASLIGQHLSGVSASSVDEAHLGREFFSGEVHVCSPAYTDRDLGELVSYVDHVVFNSFAQLSRHREILQDAGVQYGIRVNPEHSEASITAYDPCQCYSRLGVVEDEFDEDALEGVSGLHFHSLCEHGYDALARTVAAFELRFGRFMDGMKWLNLGGGHHITKEGYDIPALCDMVGGLHEKYGVEVYLEPGEAIALDAGYLVSTVIDIVKNEKQVAIVDTSASAHMPDVLEMPYRPEIVGAGRPGELAHEYRIGGATCLAGDIIGDYSFDSPLQTGDRLIFCDMAHYTMVKNTTFNGIRLPCIGIVDAATGEIRVVREFGYEDFRNRLGSI